MSPRGRRPGEPDTKGRIVDSARQEFAAQGYDATSLRAVARRAGVDPALIRHYFGGKSALFGETLAMPVRLDDAVAAIVTQAPEEMGRAAVRMFLTVWDSATGRTGFALLVRGAMSQPSAARMLREFLIREVIGRVVRAAAPEGDALDASVADRRSAAAASQMMGLGVMRYVVEFEPVASMSVEEVVDLIGPTIQRYITGA